MTEELDWYDLNIQHLNREIRWFLQVLDTRISLHFGVETANSDIESLEIPSLEPADSPYVEFVASHELNPPERLLLMLALLPYIQPNALDPLLATQQDKTPVTEFGGYKGQIHKGFLPTVETALFLLAGQDLRSRFFYQQLMNQEHRLFKDRWLRLDPPPAGEPFTSAMLTPSRELVDFISLGDMGQPEFGKDFPAQKIETNRTWDELILPTETMAEVREILDWIKYESIVMDDWGLKDKVMPGFRCLLHGPPGTGKTFATTLLGKEAGKEVYRIDLSMIVSKYIGETEKNLRNVFDKAQSRGWILFFDEADALFGKRTGISDSKDRFANQEVSYLLQRVETFDGVVMLATNNRENLDKAFTRRFQNVVNFPMPSPPERLRLWQSAIPKTCTLGEGVDLKAMAKRFELAGGSIMNVIRYCALQAAKRGEPVIEIQDFMTGIRKEYRKVGRIIK